MARISVEIVGDAASYLRSLRRSANATKTWQGEIAGATGRAKGLFGSVFKDLARPVLFGLGAGFGLGGLIEGIKSTVEAAEGLERQMNRTEAVFKDSAPTVEAWSKTTASAMGMSQQDSLKAADSFGQLFTTFGVGTPKAAGMSQQMVQLAADMASFSGKDPAAAVNALTKGLAGSFRPLRQFGVFLTQNEVRQEAATLGLTKGAVAADAAKQAYKDAAANASAADKEQTVAHRNLSSAQTELASSQRAVTTTSDALTRAQEAAQAASSALAGAQDREANAADSLTSAERTLADAKKASKDAEVALTDARKQAAEEIQLLKDAAVDGALSEQRAQLSLDQARQHLTDTMASSTATDLDKRDALLGVKEAEQSLHESQERRTSSTQASRDADKAGIDGAKGVVDARNAIATAHQSERQAAEGVVRAQRALIGSQRAVEQALIRVAQTQRTLVEDQAKSVAANERYQRAQQNLASAQARATAANQRAKAAEDQLAAAKKKSDDLNRGLTNGLTDQQRVLATYALILKNTGNQQGDFAKHADNTRNSLLRFKAMTQDLQAVIGKQLAPIITNIINKMVDWLSKTRNQHAVLNTLKTVIDIVKAAVGFLAGAFRFLSRMVGGSHNAVKLLISLFVAWKATQVASKILSIANAFGKGPGSVVGAAGRARGAAQRAAQTIEGEVVPAAEGGASAIGGLATALGPAVLGAGALAAGYALGTLIYQLPIVKQLADDAANSIASLFGYTNPMDKYKSARSNVGYRGDQIISAARGLMGRGESGAQITSTLARRFPGLSTTDYQNYVQAAARTRGAPQVHVTFNGVTDTNEIQRRINDTIARHYRQTPHVR